MSEPTRQAWDDIASILGSNQEEIQKIIQHAIDQACAEKDAEIALLRTKVNGLSISDDAKDQRIAELEEQMAAPFTGDARQAKRIQEMAALLDRVPCSCPTGVAVAEDCPACAWAKLKPTQNH